VLILSSLFLLSPKAETKSETKFNNKMFVSDIIQFITGVRDKQYKHASVMTVIQHFPMHPTIPLSTLTWCVWTTFGKLIVAGYGN